MPGRQSKTFIYSPQVQVLIATDSGVIDISEDIVNGQIRRVVNGVSQFSCVFNNRNQKYTGVLKRMDRITVSMSRVGKWVQVFAGYLDSVPGLALYVNTAQIRASCTLKLIMHNWWDPGLPESQAQILDQRLFDGSDGSVDGGTQASGKESDTGLGKMLGNLLFKVGGWPKDRIKIQNIPTGFLNLALEMSLASQTQSQKMIDELKKALGLTTAVAPTAATNTPTAIVQGMEAKPPTNTKTNQYSVPEIVSILKAAGFTPGEVMYDLVAVASFNSQGNPSYFKSNHDDSQIGGGFTKNYSIVGLFGLIVDGTVVTTATASDALASAKVLYQKSQNGTLLSAAKPYFDSTAFTAKSISPQWGAVFAAARLAAQKPDVGIVVAKGAQSAAAGVAGTTTVSTASFPTSASEDYLKGIFGNSAAAVSANLVTINFQGKQVQVHKLAAAAFQKVDAQITALNTGYKIHDIGTFEWRAMNNGTGTSTLSWHSYGIAMDINPDTNGFVAAGIGNGTHDLPDSWIAVFRQNGFTWGGDWGDYMHFQWQGGGTYIGIVNPATGNLSNIGQQSGDGTVSEYLHPIGNPFDTNLFGYLFLGQSIDNTFSTILDGSKAPINDTQLLSTVQAIASASMRSFMSGPDGTFIAFYPDYFGTSGTAPVLTIEDIELTNFSIDISDDNLATDVFVAGGVINEYNPTVTSSEWIDTAGVVNITQPGVLKLLLGIDPTVDQEYSAAAIYARFGIRPLKAEYPQVASGVMEYLQALALFQKKWSEQYSTNVSFTFLPELYPGMRILIKSHQITVYVEEVVHTFSFDSGFQTSATVSSPASIHGGFKGLNLGRL